MYRYRITYLWTHKYTHTYQVSVSVLLRKMPKNILKGVWEFWYCPPWCPHKMTPWHHLSEADFPSVFFFLTNFIWNQLVVNKRSKLQEAEDEPDWGPELTQHKIFYVGHFSCCCVFHLKAVWEPYDIWFKTVLTGKEDLSDTYMSSGGGK